MSSFTGIMDYPERSFTVSQLCLQDEYEAKAGLLLSEQQDLPFDKNEPSERSKSRV